MKADEGDTRNGLICAGISIAALLLAWPFANLPFDDDFSYSFTVKRLLETGHLLYNGWASPCLIAGSYWGLLWVKLFGFSFNVLRVSTLPMAAGSVVLCHALARRAGLTSSLSAFAALMLGLSPIFMPLAATFMTDVPGLFFLLLTTYTLVRGFDSSERLPSIAWITTASVAALIGGSSRQIVWIAPLVSLPYFAVVRRNDFVFVGASVINWLVVIVGATLMQRWYAHQPYSLPDPPLSSYFVIVAQHSQAFIIELVKLSLTLVMVVLPAAIGTLRGRPGIRLLIGIGGACVVFCPGALGPWLGNIVTLTGVLVWVEVHGARATVITPPMQYVLTVGIFISLSMLIASSVFWLWTLRRESKQNVLFFFFGPPGKSKTIQTLLLTLVSLATLEVSRAAFHVAYDRHLLAWIPYATIPLLARFQYHGLQKMTRLGWCVLLCFALYAIGSTQEINSLARARVVAVKQLEKAGVPDLQIDAGFEHNFWAALQSTGHVNDPRIVNPPGVYQEGKNLIPALLPLYRLETALTPVTTATPFGSVTYFSLLPPFNRKVYIDRFIFPWWLNPAKKSGYPSAITYYIPQILLDQYPQSVRNTPRPQ